ncbi:MAG: cupin domain-containing protein [Pseudomonadota bacterium]
MKIVAKDAPQARAELGDMARGLEAGGHMMALMSLPDGTDFCQFLKGLPHDHCQCPHWGYLLEGQIKVDYQDGSSEVVEPGDLYYWPPGHTIAVQGDTRYIEFSPADQLSDVLDHVVSRLPKS